MLHFIFGTLITRSH